MTMLDGIEFFSSRENLGSLDKVRIDHDFITWRNKHHLRACNFQDIATLELLGASTLQQIRVDFHSIPAIDPHMPATSIGVVCIVENRGMMSRHDLTRTEIDVNR